MVKKINYGEWIYGVPVFDGDKAWIVKRIGDNFSADEVHPESVGEYTGLKDSKSTAEFPDGQEIYEDDISTKEEMLFPLHGTRTGIVKYIDGSYLLEDLDGKDGDYLFSESAEITVIGNIHDNPELLQPPREGRGCLYDIIQSGLNLYREDDKFE
ncbi:YopX family protein [Paenibacillus sp. UKAQ_18]|nr:YopX family protein [Paenibacillus sp. UKAQ_18]